MDSRSAYKIENFTFTATTLLAAGSRRCPVAALDSSHGNAAMERHKAQTATEACLSLRGMRSMRGSSIIFIAANSSAVRFQCLFKQAMIAQSLGPPPSRMELIICTY